MLDSLRSRPRCVFDISFVDLIDNMMCMFHDQFPNEAASVASNWSHFSGGLSRFLHNFLRLQDCFRDSPTGPCLEVDFDFHYADSVVTATGTVTWQAPEVRFLNLSNSLSSGEKYQIMPFTLSGAIEAFCSQQGSSHYTDETTFTVSRSSLSLAWSSEVEGFTTVLPDFGDVGVLNISGCTLADTGCRTDRMLRRPW